MIKSKSILFVLPRKPWPPYAGQVRLAYSRAKELRKLGNNVHLICFGWGVSVCAKSNIKDLKKAFNTIETFDINIIDFFISGLIAFFMTVFFRQPLQIYLLSSPLIKNKFKNFIKKNNFGTIHFYSARTYSLWIIIEKLKKNFVIDLVDSLTLNLGNKIKNNKGFSKLIWLNEYLTFSKFERNLPNFKYCNSYLTVSKIDAEFLKTRLEKNSLNICNPINVSNIGIEINKSRNINLIKKNQLIFFGSLWYEPNVNAILWLVHEIMPLVLQEEPKIQLLIAGANPSKALLNAISKKDYVKMVPNPLNIENLIKESNLSVAPMLSGSGQQFKLIESLALKTPVITTSKASNPLGLKDNKHALVCNNKISFSQAILKLMKNEEIRSKLSQNGYKFVVEKYNWEKIVLKLLRDCY